MQGVCMGFFVLLGVLMLLQWATQMSPRWGYANVAPMGYTDGAPMGLCRWRAGGDLRMRL